MLPSAFELTDALEIIILTGSIYAILRFLRNTRGSRLLKGLGTFILFAGLFLTVLDFAAPGGMNVIKSILSIVTPYLAVIIVVLFQEEIRVGISRFSQGKFQSSTWLKNLLFLKAQETSSSKNLITVLNDACTTMAKSKTGALIAIECNDSLESYANEAIKADIPLSSIILQTIFFDGAPMHDGATIIRDERILATKCLFPISTAVDLNVSYGTRHRAAIGLSEKSDATVIVISEETGEISIAANGKLHKPISIANFQPTLKKFLSHE